MRNSVISTGMLAALLSTALLLASCGGGNDQAVTAIPASVSIAAPRSVESATAVQFGSSAGALAGLKYQWDFGDGSSSNEAAPSHSYTRGGDFEVLLKVSNAAGESRETRTKLTITNLANVRGLECSGPENTGWCWQSPRPTGNAIATVYFVDASTGWRGGEAGDVFSTVDGGVTWQRQRSTAMGSIFRFKFLDRQTGWALSSLGEVLRTGDGGKSWAVSALPVAPVGQDASDIEATNAKAIYAKLDSKVFASSDGGVTWRSIAGQADVSPAGRVWTLQGNSLQVTDDGGLTFTSVLEFAGQTYGDTLLRVGETRAVVVRRGKWADSDPGTYTTIDGGKSWQKMVDGYFTPYGLQPAWVSADGRVFVAYAARQPEAESNWYRSEDAGQHWTYMGSGTDVGRYSATPAGTLLHHNARSGVYELSQDGWTWQAVRACTDGVMRYAEKTGLLVCQRSMDLRTQFYLSKDMGKNWQLIVDVDRSNHQDIDGQNWPRSLLDFSDAKHGFLIDASGNGRSTADGGATWQLKAAGLGRGSWLRLVGNRTAWMINAQGKLVKSIDGGETWIENDGATYIGEKNSPKVSYVALGFENEALGWYRRINPNGDYMFTQYGVTRDGGLSWERVSFPLPYYVASMRLGSKAWLALSDGAQELLVSTDNGKTWVVNRNPEEIRAPVFSDDATIWAVSSAGSRLLKSEDFGAHWSEVSLPATSRILTDVKFANAKVGWVVGDSGLILKTQDGGKTWQQQASGTKLMLTSICVVDTQTAWVMGREGVVLATGTGGD
ncbi:YCF48-related protein [Paucibacter sp. APW11]|uniref:YCF48-related protein n=1 Tax=Roseateles aquae TaxID=3077235 RepID=A0ABU3PGM8_9BURK|nr:YCF48-related protein [Paucibacter sp. APW11]MDT9001689.1 YCF48-related protein [Paucibacter sp. APW11]